MVRKSLVTLSRENNARFNSLSVSAFGFLRKRFWGFWGNLRHLGGFRESMPATFAVGDLSMFEQYLVVADVAHVRTRVAARAGVVVSATAARGVLIRCQLLLRRMCYNIV